MSELMVGVSVVLSLVGLLMLMVGWLPRGVSWHLWLCRMGQVLMGLLVAVGWGAYASVYRDHTALVAQTLSLMSVVVGALGLMMLSLLAALVARDSSPRETPSQGEVLE